MASSEDLLQDTVFHLLSHNQSVDKTLAEVCSLRQTCKDDNLFAGLTELGCLPVLTSYERTSSSHDGYSVTDVCTNRILSVCKSGQLCEAQKAELQTVTLMLNQLKQTGSFNSSRFHDILSEHPSMPLEILCALQKEGIFSLEKYLSRQQGKKDAQKTFLSVLYETHDLQLLSGMLSELLCIGFTEGRTVKGNIQKLACNMMDRVILNFVDGAMSGTVVSETIPAALSRVQLDMDTLTKAYTHLLTIVLSHKPVLKVSQAIREQGKWAYGKIVPQLTQLYKQFMFQLMLAFDDADIVKLLRQVLEQHEVNWQLLLSFVSVITVCIPESTRLFLEFTDGLLQEGLDSCEIETTIMGMLLARQACFQGPHVFLSYSDWFQRTFSDSSRSLASTRKSFTFLVKFLTDLVPYETAEHIKVHILRPPFVPAKCRQLLTDYAALAKTRLADLKESLDIPGVDDCRNPANEKGKCQLVSEIESTVGLYETTGKVPTSILEASIFRKPYYVGHFLPGLLQARPLPDVPDNKMKLIAALKRADKIPLSMYKRYEKECKSEANELLEAVFLDLDSDDEMQLSPFEQLENALQQLVKMVKTRTKASKPKYTVFRIHRDPMICDLHEHAKEAEDVMDKKSEVLSMLCDRLESVLSLSTGGHLQSAAYVAMDTENINIDSLQLKVIDALLNSISHALRACYTSSDPRFTWLSKLIQALSQYPVVIQALYKRIWTLTTTQRVSLDNHHIDCIAAILVEIQLLGEQLPWIHIRNEVQGDTTEINRKTFTENLLAIACVRSSSWMGFSLRLTTSYMKYMFSSRKDVDQCLILPIVIKKFIYLSTRLCPGLRYYVNMDNSTLTSDLVSAVYMSESFQDIAKIVPLLVCDWIDYEISVCPDDDILTHCQRYEYFTWIVYRHFLSTGKESYHSIASSILHGILKSNTRMYGHNEGCSRCHSLEKGVSSTNSRSHLICLLQELTRMFSQYSQEKHSVLPWLPQQLMDHVTTSETQQHTVVLQFFRLCLSLPAYLMFGNTPHVSPAQGCLTHIIQFINGTIVQHLCEGMILPASVSAYLSQGMLEVSGEDRCGDVLNQLCHTCPVLLIAIIVNHRAVEPFILPMLKQKHPLKLMFDCIRDSRHYCTSMTEPWQQAVLLFSAAMDSYSRATKSIFKDFIAVSSDTIYQQKVSCCLVQMANLQLTYVQYLTETQDQCQQQQLHSVLDDVLQWTDGNNLPQMFFADQQEENSRLCVCENLIRLKNLTILRYLCGQHTEVHRGKFQTVACVTGILKAFRDVMDMYDKHPDALQVKPLTVEDLGVLSKCVVSLIETIPPAILRDIDQDLLLASNPTIADCAIKILSSK